MKTKLLIAVLLLLVFTVSVWGATTPKVYVAKLLQTSGSAPEVVTELENTIGTVTWSRLEQGRFRLTRTGAFPDEAKIVGLREWHYIHGGSYHAYWDDEAETSGDSLLIETFNASGQLSDNIFTYNDFRIEVYP